MKLNNKIILNDILILIMIFELFYMIKLDIQNQKEITELTIQNTALQQNIFNLQNLADNQEKEIQTLQTLPPIPMREPEPEPEPAKVTRAAERPRYNLSESERKLIEQVVMAEAGGESYEGQILVSQCILNACELNNIRPPQAIKQYAYAKSRPTPSDSVRQAVETVFDRGEKVTEEPIVYFYAPGVVRSEFHESQIFAVEEGGHRFFKKREG